MQDSETGFDGIYSTLTEFDLLNFSEQNSDNQINFISSAGTNLGLTPTIYDNQSSFNFDLPSNTFDQPGFTFDFASATSIPPQDFLGNFPPTPSNLQQDFSIDIDFQSELDKIYNETQAQKESENIDYSQLIAGLQQSLQAYGIEPQLNSNSDCVDNASDIKHTSPVPEYVSVPVESSPTTASRSFNLTPPGMKNDLTPQLSGMLRSIAHIRSQSLPEPSPKTKPSFVTKLFGLLPSRSLDPSTCINTQAFTNSKQAKGKKRQIVFQHEHPNEIQPVKRIKKASKKDTFSNKSKLNHQAYCRLMKEKPNFQAANLKGTLVALKEVNAPDPKAWIAVVVEFLEEKLNQTSEQSEHIKEVFNYLTCTLKNLDSTSPPCPIRPLSDQAKCLIRYLVNRLHPKATENEVRFRHISRRIANQCVPLLHKQLGNSIGSLKKVDKQNTCPFIPIFYRPEFNPLNIAPAQISCMTKSLKKKNL